MSDSNGVENALWIKGNVEKQAGVELKKKKNCNTIFTQNLENIFLLHIEWSL